MLKCVLCGSKHHLQLIHEGWRVHHVDSNFGLSLVYMEPPKVTKLEKL
jgi:hypothetical protein